jgi:4-hydroxy-2-oxoheptanedioate aldolase
MNMFEWRKNKIIERTAKGEVALGMQMYTPSPELYELVGYAGFDYVMIDMEHSRVNYETMVNLIRTCEAVGLTPMVRVPGIDPTAIRYARESGAMGIVVPHVKTPEDVDVIQAALRMPPEGRGGICPSIRACGYAQPNWQDYLRYANENICLFCLIEDVEGVDNVEKIFEKLRPGRDGYGLGLADIAHALYKDANEPVNWQHPYTKEATEKVVAVGQRLGLLNQGMAWPTPDKAGYDNATKNGVNVLLFHPDQDLFARTLAGIIGSIRG